MSVRSIVTLLSLVSLQACAGPTAVAGYRPSFDPAQMTDRPAGAANAVVVLGSPHLSQLPDTFRPESAAPLVERLIGWRPTAIALEESSGLLCDSMRRQSPRVDAQTIAAYCYDPATARAATGLEVPAAAAEAERLLATLPQDPAPQMRRRLAAVFLAAGEPMSALVQWLRLPASERIAEGSLTPELVAQLAKRMENRNESSLIGARVAAASGLERVWGVDDQSGYQGDTTDEAAYESAMSAAWDNQATKARIAESTALTGKLGEPGGLLAMYRAYNAPAYALQAYRSDWGAALAEPSPRGYGRRYVTYWEVRNLRMAANIREVLGRRPGTRLLAIVGASHKGYYEAYLRQMRDVELQDVGPLLAK